MSLSAIFTLSNCRNEHSAIFFLISKLRIKCEKLGISDYDLRSYMYEEHGKGYRYLIEDLLQKIYHPTKKKLRNVGEKVSREFQYTDINNEEHELYYLNSDKISKKEHDKVMQKSKQVFVHENFDIAKIDFETIKRYIFNP